MHKKLILATGILWIGGLAAAITGMNIEGDAAKWLVIGGNAAFLIGLALAGVVWALKSKEKPPEETPAESGESKETGGQ